MKKVECYTLIRTLENEVVKRLVKGYEIDETYGAPGEYVVYKNGEKWTVIDKRCGKAVTPWRKTRSDALAVFRIRAFDALKRITPEYYAEACAEYDAVPVKEGYVNAPLSNHRLP